MKPHPLLTLQIVLGCLSLALVSCNPSGPSRASLELRNELEQANQNLIEAQQTTKRLQSQLEASRAEKAKLDAAVKDAETKKTEAAQELERVKREFDTYKSKYKTSLRARVPGLELPAFEIAGQHFDNPVISSFTEDFIAFQHKGGLGKALLSELPEQVRDILALTAIHQVTAPSENISMNLTDKQRYQLAKDTYNRRRAEIIKKLKANSLAQTDVHSEVSKIESRITRARQDGSESVSKLETYLEQLKLRGGELDVEAVRLELEAHQITAEYVTRN